MDPKTIKHRHDSLVAERAAVNGVWDEIEKFVSPFRGGFYTRFASENSVGWRDYERYDATATQAASTLAASIQGSLISPAARWFELSFADKGLSGDVTARQWLEECSDILWDALQASNFNREVAETLLDLTTYHSAFLMEEWDEQDDSLFFEAVPVREGFVETDHRGRPIFFSRVLEWPLSRIIAKFGEDALPESLRDRADSPQAQTERHEILFAVYQRDDVTDVDTSGPLPPERRPWAYRYLLLAKAEPLGDEGGYYEMPAFFVRWLKTAGSKYGHGPSHIALADIKTLNTAKYLTLLAAEKAIDPPTIGRDQGVISDLDLKAGGHTVVRDVDDIKPLMSGADPGLMTLELQMLQQAIRQTYRVDELELKESPAMTASEVRVRYELMNRLLGPTLGRLQSDLLDPIVETTFAILYRQGAFPVMPDSVREGSGYTAIEYLGPLARSQRAEASMAMSSLVAEAVQLAQVDPEVLDNLDLDEYLRLKAEMIGAPADIVRTDAQVRKVRNARRQQQARQAELQQRAAVAEVAKVEAEAEQARVGGTA